MQQQGSLQNPAEGNPSELRHYVPPHSSSAAAAVRYRLPFFGFYALVTKDAPRFSFSITCPVLSNSAPRCWHLRACAGLRAALGLRDLC